MKEFKVGDQVVDKFGYVSRINPKMRQGEVIYTWSDGDMTFYKVKFPGDPPKTFGFHPANLSSIHEYHYGEDFADKIRDRIK